MPRPPRAALAYHAYRIARRDAVRRAIAGHDGQFRAFRRLLRRAGRGAPLDLYAWCLLPGHWHVVVPPAALRALTAYVARDAECRFVTVPIADERQLATTLLYVEAGPLRARLVERAERWRWSSLRERVAPSGRRRLSIDGPWEIPANWVDLVNELGREGVPWP
jgi:putative transposase